MEAGRSYFWKEFCITCGYFELKLLLKLKEKKEIWEWGYKYWVGYLSGFKEALNPPSLREGRDGGRGLRTDCSKTG